MSHSHEADDVVAVIAAAGMVMVSKTFPFPSVNWTVPPPFPLDVSNLTRNTTVSPSTADVTTFADEVAASTTSIVNVADDAA